MAPVRSKSRGRTRTRTRSVSRRRRSAPATPILNKRYRSKSSSNVSMKSRRSSLAPMVYKRYGAPTSKSKGFFAKGRKRKTYLDRTPKAGIDICAEVGGVFAPGVTIDTMYIGHGTTTFTSMMRDLAYAMTKFIAIKLDRDITDMNEQCFATGDNYLVVIEWKERNNVVVSNCAAVNITNAVSTWLSVATDLQGQITTSLTNSPFGQLTTLTIRNVTAPLALKRYDLRRASVLFKCKSSLKLQNRTVNTVGDFSSDDVDNVPLYGKSYEGNGNYFRYVPGGNTGTAGTDLATLAPAAGTSNGVGLISDSFSKTQALGEPPKPSQLINVKKNGKAHLDPAEIKTSVIYHTIKIRVNTFFAKFRLQGTMAPETKLGNYRIFAFEKMIKTATEVADSQMKIAYEIDEKRICTFYAPKTPVTNTVVLLAQ